MVSRLFICTSLQPFAGKLLKHAVHTFPGPSKFTLRIGARAQVADSHADGAYLLPLRSFADLLAPQSRIVPLCIQWPRLTCYEFCKFPLADGRAQLSVFSLLEV